MIEPEEGEAFIYLKLKYTFTFIVILFAAIDKIKFIPPPPPQQETLHSSDLIIVLLIEPDSYHCQMDVMHTRTYRKHSKQLFYLVVLWWRNAFHNGTKMRHAKYCELSVFKICGSGGSASLLSRLMELLFCCLTFAISMYLHMYNTDYSPLS